MNVNQFFQYELRTTDQESAREFYAHILGPQFWGSARSVAPLPARAVALGAPPHWLGYINTNHVERTISEITIRGGQQLGPLQQDAKGSLRGAVRDPFGAVMGVSSETTQPKGTAVAWHLHHSQDHARAYALYAELFGWAATDLLELGPPTGLGSHQMFAWQASGPTVGSMANTARPGEIHPQWLFFFPTADLESSLVQVRARGGTPLNSILLPSGDRVAPCNDPQGGAFGLYQFHS